MISASTTRRTGILGLLAVAALISTSGCSTGAGGDPADAATAPPTVATTTTQAPVSTTIPPTTTTTTVAPTTTTTIEPRPGNVVLVGLTQEAFVAVGDEDGDDTARIQQRLADLGFWHSGVDGEYGITTTQAVMAFQKYHGLSATGSVDEVTAETLGTVTERARAASPEGTLVEVDKARQLLFLVKDGHTVWVINASTGSEIPYEVENKKDPSRIERGDSVTPAGTFATDRERAEGWWEGDLGRIYRPKYFRGGVAVHGSLSIPNYPASHGCVRVSVPAMDMIWDTGLVPLRTTVWVHGEIPTAPL